MRIRRVIVSMAFAALAAPSAFADSITITGGSVYLPSSFSGSPPYGFTLTGNLTELNGEHIDYGLAGFPNGGVANVSATLNPSRVNHTLPEVVGGTTYNAYLGGVLNLIADPLATSALADGTSGSFSTPFRLVGHLLGFLNPDRTGPPLFTIDVTGSGTAFFPVRNTGTTNILPIGTTFTFGGAPSPTPEPTTLLLMGAGLCAVARRCRRGAKSA